MWVWIVFHLCIILNRTKLDATAIFRVYFWRECDMRKLWKKNLMFLSYVHNNVFYHCTLGGVLLLFNCYEKIWEKCAFFSEFSCHWHQFRFERENSLQKYIRKMAVASCLLRFHFYNWITAILHLIFKKSANVGMISFIWKIYFALAKSFIPFLIANRILFALYFQ